MPGPRPETSLILCLLCFICFVGRDAEVCAADVASERPVYELEEIVVTATRMETPKEEVAANITVITRDEIEKMPASYAAEVLQYVPSVYVEFAGGLGSQTVAFIQGSDVSNVHQVAVYQDGVPLNQLANPLTDLSYLPVDTIERIEIYKGAASSAWGSSLGGVINIITKEPDPKKPFAAEIRTLYGEFETLKSRGTLSGTVDRLGYLLSFTHDESDGFMEHTEYEQDAIYGKINYEVGETSRLNFVYSWDKGRNADPIIDDPEFWDDNRRRRVYERLLFDTSPTDDLFLTIEGRHHRFYNWIDDVFSDHREIFNDYEEETWGVSARMTYDTIEAHRLVVGFDRDWGTYDWIWYEKEYDTRNWAFYANDTFTRGSFSFNTGIRYDDNLDFGSEVSPSAGVVYRIFEDKALVRAQVAKGFSAPPSAWVNDPRGKRDLEPEVGINYQLGCEVQPFRFLRLELNLFRADIEDLIRYNWDTEELENIAEVTRQGIEGRISTTFDFGLTVSFGGSYVDVRDEETDKVIKDIPRTLFDISASYTDERMTHSIVGKYIDHNSIWPETHDEVFVFDYLLKVKLPWPEPYGRLDFYGAVHNLTNTSYIYREVFPQPDRWIEAGVSFRF